MAGYKYGGSWFRCALITSRAFTCLTQTQICQMHLLQYFCPMIPGRKCDIVLEHDLIEFAQMRPLLSTITQSSRFVFRILSHPCQMFFPSGSNACTVCISCIPSSSHCPCSLHSLHPLRSVYSLHFLNSWLPSLHLLPPWLPSLPSLLSTCSSESE